MTARPEDTGYDYAADARYCGAQGKCDGVAVVCWRPAGHEGNHQGEVAGYDATYGWPAARPEDTVRDALHQMHDIPRPEGGWVRAHALAALDALLAELAACCERAETAEQARAHLGQRVKLARHDAEMARYERGRAEALLADARRAIVAHHAVGALDGILPGDECPVCARLDAGERE